MEEILIIGSGPAGLTAAIYASRARIQALVVEQEPMGTGRIAVTDRVENYPGLLGVDGFSLGEKFREHAEALGAQFRQGEVTRLTKADGVFTAALDDGSEISAKSVIYAAGASCRKLEIPGAQLPGVSYCATCDGAFYAGKTVTVIGGGDTALEEALYLSRIAAQVYLVHRRETFRANAALQESVRQTANIHPVLQAVPTEIVGSKRVETLKLLQNGKPETLTTDGIFIAIGHLPDTAVLGNLAALDETGYLQAGEDGVTSCPGLFAAGDVRTKALRQVITAAADGANCVAAAEAYLRNTAEKRENP